jgi:hypothetical protein
MGVQTVAPDLQVSLHLDRYAPRAARYHVSQVGRPSPDLRDAVVLLTSELVSRAVEHCAPGSDAEVELLAWMPPDVVRVELRAPHELLDTPEHKHWSNYDLLLLDQIADRWSIEHGQPAARMWFEIDRHPAGGYG